MKTYRELNMTPTIGDVVRRFSGDNEPFYLITNIRGGIVLTQTRMTFNMSHLLTFYCPLHQLSNTGEHND